MFNLKLVIILKKAYRSQNAFNIKRNNEIKWQNDRLTKELQSQFLSGYCSKKDKDITISGPGTFLLSNLAIEGIVEEIVLRSDIYVALS